MAERLVLCGPAEAKCAQNDETLRLSLDGPQPNIALRIEDVSRRLVANVPNLLTDLVEIATYVFCADRAVSRGGDVMKAMGTGGANSGSLSRSENQSAGHRHKSRSRSPMH